MALVTLNTVIARDAIDLKILQLKTGIVGNHTGVEHMEAVEDLGNGTFRYTVSAEEADINNLDYVLGMPEAVILIEDAQQQAAALAEAFGGFTMQ